MQYNISAHSLPKSIVGISKDEKGELARAYSNTLYDISVPRDLLVPYLQQSQVWSPFQFHGYKRNQINSKLSVGLLVFDSDEDVKFNEVKERFSKVFEHFIIMPSSGWTPEYEKYRIIVPLSENIDLISNHHYRMIMQYFAGELGIELDTKAMETARFFFSDFNAGIAAYDTGGVNHISIINRVTINRSASEILKSLTHKNKSYSGQIEPKHLVNNPLYLKYLADIGSGNYHNGELAMIGYLKKCGCNSQDIESHIIDIRSITGSNPSDIQHRNRMSIL